MNTEKVDIGTQYVEGEEISVQSVETTFINHEMEVKLGILANRLLHGSYWFLILDMMFRTKFQLIGLAKAARMREATCRESASSIMSWVREVGGKVRLVDIARPDYGKEENFTIEYGVRTMATLDTWLEQGVMEVLASGVSEANDVLKAVLEKHRDYHWESQGMKDKIFLQQ